MKYFTLSGDYLQAYCYCLNHGGQLFPGNGQDSANVVVIGQNCFTFWKEGSKRKQEVEKLSIHFGLDPQGQTGGRIARWLIENLLALPYQKTYWSRTYRNLAKQGNHWHYMHCDVKKDFWGLEVDIKSAYFSSLFTFQSLLYSPNIGYLNDNNSLENLKILFPSFPKWFRLQLLGCLSSWRISFLCRDKRLPDNEELVLKTRHFIKYNAAFNTAHRAILRNYKIMKKIHEIGGEYIRRIHTDSFLLDSTTPGDIEKKLFDYLEEKKLTYSLKGWGRCFFWDLNTGFIGNKFVGASIDVTSRMRADGVKMSRKKANENVLELYTYFVDSPEELLKSLEPIVPIDDSSFLQNNLFNVNDYVCNYDLSIH